MSFQHQNITALYKLFFQIRYTLNSDSYVYADSDFPSAIVLFVIVVILIVVVLIVCCRDNEPRDTNAPIVVYERPVYYDNYYNRYNYAYCKNFRNLCICSFIFLKYQH